MKHIFRKAASAFLSRCTSGHVGLIIAVGLAAICAPSANAQVPGAPTSVTATPGDSKIAIGWTAPSGTITGYNVYRGTTANGESATPINTSAISAAAIKYTDTSVAGGPPNNGTQYYYQVAAINSSGVGTKSSEVTAIPVAIPTAPSTLLAVGHTGHVSLSWTAPPQTVTSYRVYRSTTSGSETLLASPLGTGVTYTDNSVTNGTKYYYKVLALNGSGTSPLSAESSATPVAIPTSVSATAGPEKVAVNWTAPTVAVDSYNIYGHTSSTTETFITNKPAPLIKYLATGLTDGTTYYYRIAAVLNGSESDKSLEVSGTPVAPPDPPASLTATPGIGKVILAWSLPGGTILNIKVYRGTSAGAETFLAQANGAPTIYTDTAVTDGIPYYYKVSATIAVGGEGAKSNEASATPVQYDVVLDYSGFNPNTTIGPWYYGSEQVGGGTFSIYIHNTTGTVGLDTYTSWYTDASTLPGLSHNNSTNTINNGWTFPPNMILIHPGQNGDRSVLRWVAPSTGTIKLTGQFSGQDSTSTDASIVLTHSTTTTSLFTTPVIGLGDTHAFSLTQSVSASDGIEFSVGDGGNGYAFDSTGVQASISYIP